MELKVSIVDVCQAKADTIILPLCEGHRKLDGEAAALNDKLNGAILQVIRRSVFEGKAGQTLCLHTLGLIGAKSVLLTGIGSKENLTENNYRKAAACAARQLPGLKSRTAIFVHCERDMEKTTAVEAAAEGLVMGSYEFSIKRDMEEPKLKSVTFVATKEERDAVRAAARRGNTKGGATNLARDLANAVPAQMNPETLSLKARAIAEERGLTFTCYEQQEIQQMGMGALDAVGRGSDIPPRLLVIEYRGAGKDVTPIGLVGKGVTFDSGGLSLKTAEGMEAMKGDMSGAAAVLAAMDAIAQLELRANVTAIVPTVENLPSSKAYKPGDIVTAKNGKTIEVLNTDAEGRLILADALCHASDLGLSPVIDLATLTGACSIAVGPFCTGLFGNNSALIQEVLATSEATGELMWHLPCAERPEFKELIKGKFSDIKNTGGRAGGAITAAWFLHHFIEGTPWCHLDIASTMISDSDKDYTSKGMTGVGARTCIEFVERRQVCAPPVAVEPESGAGSGEE
ncbi:MAG: leucyl aminopeptidase [Planctomycetota bacterium]|nr:leucyl aminopeptidase [Planctomycetota bacterium]MDA1142537.1 leucyl aminopeptidase [Planctomycetota bacterium]